MKKILVTGGLGFIGSHTIIELHHAGYTPVIIDDLSNSELFILDRIEKIIQTKVIYHQIDCCNQAAFNQVIESEKTIEGIIHFAAFKSVNESVDQPLKYYRNNLNSLLVVLEAMEKYNIKNLIFSSSCTVYGQPEVLPVTESTPYGEIKTAYGKTKRMCEDIISDFVVATKNKNAIALRYFNPIGAHPSGLIGELPKGIPNNLMPFITQTAKGIRKELNVFGFDYNTADGTCVRDFIHVVDLAKAHVQSLNYLFKNNAVSSMHCFNVGTGKGTTVLEMIHAFEKANDIKLNYKLAPKREGDIEKIYADTSNFESNIGWKAELAIENACKDAWNWEKNVG